MKTYCRGLVVDEATVMRALEEWEGTRAGRKNAWRVPREHGSREALVHEVFEEVRGRRLKFRPIRYGERMEGGKVRRIGVESVKQQVAGQVLIMCARPLFEARVGRYQCAGVAGRGQTYAARAVRRWLDRGDCRYWSKSDLHKCYQSVRHDVAREWFARHVGSADLRYIVDALLDSYGACGLNLGGHASLFIATLLLSDAYHFVEGLGRRRRGKWVPDARHQAWHLDDMVLMGSSKTGVARAMRSLECFMHDSLGLEMKPWKVCRAGEGEPVDLGGFVSRPGRTAVRAGTFLRLRRAFRRYSARPGSTRLAARVTSYWGYLRNSDSYLAARRMRAHELVARAGRTASLEARRYREATMPTEGPAGAQ